VNLYHKGVKKLLYRTRAAATTMTAHPPRRQQLLATQAAATDGGLGLGVPVQPIIRQLLSTLGIAAVADVSVRLCVCMSGCLAAWLPALHCRQHGHDAYIRVRVKVMGSIIIRTD
jgi:hypothetical protein